MILGTALLLVVLARSPRISGRLRLADFFLAGLLLANEFLWWGIAIAKGFWQANWGLPLQICDLAIFASAYCLFRHHQLIWELAYFWGLGATLQALITPDLHVSFPQYYFFKFFITHGCIVIAVIYLAAGLRRPILFSSALRVWVITNVYALFVIVFNALTGANYLYLMRKPAQPSLLDYLGPWPVYLLGLEALLVLSLGFYYLPYVFVNRRTQRHDQT